MSRALSLLPPCTLGLLLSVALCACGGGDDNNKNSGGSAGVGGSSAGSGGAGGSGGSSGSAPGGSAGSSGSSGSAGTAGSGGTGPLPGAFLDGQISGGALFGCAIDSSKKLYCFGQGQDWSEQDPSNVGRAWVAAGGRSFCSVASAGDVTCTGDLSKSPSGTFSQVVVTGSNEGCGIKTDGSVACWGKLADTWTVPAGKYKWLSAGPSFVCGVHDTGSVECWGVMAITMGIPTGMFERVYGGDVTSCAVAASGAVSCWGNTAAEIPKDLVVKQMAIGNRFECALLPSGAVQCFGMDASIVGMEPKDTFSAIGAGAGMVCGFTTTHKLMCWGDVPQQPPPAFVAP